MAALLALTVASAGCGGAVGKLCAGPEEVLAAFPDHVQIGIFGRHWPATIQSVETAHGELRFRGADGTPHVYSGLAGYDLAAVRLADAQGRETVLVLRSRSKTSGAN